MGLWWGQGFYGASFLVDDPRGPPVTDSPLIDFNAAGCTDATRLSAWTNDGSWGSAWDAAQASSSYQPLCTSVDGGAGDYLTFDDTRDDNMTANSLGSVYTPTVTVCVVAKVITTPGASYEYLLNSSTSNRAVELQGVSGGWRNPAVTALGGPDVGNFHVVCSAMADSGGTHKGWYDGTEKTAAAGGDINFESYIYINRDNASITRGGDYDIKRIMVLEGDVGALASAELQSEYGL